MESPAETKEDENGSLVVGGVEAAAAYIAPAYPLDDPYGYPAIEVDEGLMLNWKKRILEPFWNYTAVEAKNTWLWAMPARGAFNPQVAKLLANPEAAEGTLEAQLL